MKSRHDEDQAQQLAHDNEKYAFLGVDFDTVGADEQTRRLEAWAAKEYDNLFSS